MTEIESLIKQIEASYGISVASYSPAPRGFWAETYRLETSIGRLFLKLHKNYPWTSELTRSLYVQCRLSASVDFIPSPVMAADGVPYLMAEDGSVASLYAFIDGTSYVSRDASEVFGLIRGVYSQCVDGGNAYACKLYAESYVDAMKNGGQTVQSPALKRYLEQYNDVYVGFYDEYRRLNKYACEIKKPLYLTHGDVAKNMMRDKYGKLYIIDWDRIRYSTPELDLREFVDADTDMAELDRLAADAGLRWRFDRDMYNYFVLNDLYYYLRNLMRSDAVTLDEVAVGGYREYAEAVGRKLL